MNFKKELGCKNSIHIPTISRLFLTEFFRRLNELRQTVGKVDKKEKGQKNVRRTIQNDRNSF